MSFKTEQEATQEAHRVSQLMKTKGWKIRVHQNAGWHFALHNLGGKLSLHQSEYGEQLQYWTLFSISHPGCGDPHFTQHGVHFADPNEAVSFQMEAVENYFTTLQKLHKQFTQLKKKLK